MLQPKTLKQSLWVQKQKKNEQLNLLDEEILCDEAIETSCVTNVRIKRQDGSMFEGQIMRNGFGRETDKFGNVYQGMWSMDQRHGQGTMQFRDGSTYEGNWHENLFNGQGTLTIKQPFDLPIDQKIEGEEEDPICLIRRALRCSSEYCAAVVVLHSVQGQFVKGVVNGQVQIVYGKDAKTAAPLSFEGKITNGLFEELHASSLSDKQAMQ